MFNVAKSTHLRKNNIKHYESGFIPRTVSLDILRASAFSPTVYRKPSVDELKVIYLTAAKKKELTEEETQAYIKARTNFHKNGYRAYKFVIGLLDSGYVDIDGIKPNSIGELPTLENVNKAMTDNNLYNIVFQSASAKAGKLRLIYKRDFMLYLPGTYTAHTNEWELIPPTSRQILTTAPELHDIHNLIAKTNDIKKLIQTILYQETMYISSILALANINTSGIDASACSSHMHSAHTTIPNRKYTQPLMFLEGAAL